MHVIIMHGVLLDFSIYVLCQLDIHHDHSHNHVVLSFSFLLGEASMFQPNYVITGIGSTYTICLKRRMQRMVTE